MDCEVITGVGERPSPAANGSMMERKLKGIPETMLIPLWARAFESKRPDPIIRDECAMDMIAGVDYDFSKFEGSWLTQVGVAVRTHILDTVVRRFVENRAGVVVINLGAGLDTRYERLKCGNISCWYDLDVPESIEMRRLFLTESDGNRFIAKSLFDFSWLDDVDIGGRPVILIAEGLLMYFAEEELKPLFVHLADRLKGADMLFEMLAPFLVGKSRHHESLKKIGSQVEFKWGLVNARRMESWSPGIKYVKEWNYYHYHRERWKWFGVIGRMPIIGQRLSNRIVHLTFQS